MRMSVRNDIASAVKAWRGMFLITLFFVSAASALFFLDVFRSYESEVRILVVGRSAAVNPEQASANLAALVGTLPFYDRLAADDILDDPLAGYPQADRRARWHDTVQAVREADGSIIVITAAGEDPDEARVLAGRVGKTLFGMAGLYYDVKSGIDMRTIEGPVAETVIKHPVAYAAASLFSALAVTAVFFGFLIALPALLGRSRRNDVSEPVHAGHAVSGYGIGDAVPYIDPSKFIPVRPSSLPYEERYAGLPSDIHVPSAKAAAPDNLPIADAFDLPVSDEPLPFEFEEPAEESVEIHPLLSDEETVEPTVTMEADASGESVSPERGEPTAEEYKRRLNELLSGGR